jgi:hypothetical protein
MTDPFYILIVSLFMHVSYSAYRGIKKQQKKGVAITFEHCVYYCAGHFLIWGAALIATLLGVDFIISIAI